MDANRHDTTEGAGMWGLSRVGLLLLVAVLASGCTTWTKPGATEFETQATKSRCEAHAQMAAPAMPYQHLVSPARQDPPSTFCQTDSKGVKTCTSQPGIRRDAVYRSEDANAGPRSAVFRDCMFSHGFRPE